MQWTEGDVTPQYSTAVYGYYDLYNPPSMTTTYRKLVNGTASCSSFFTGSPSLNGKIFSFGSLTYGTGVSSVANTAGRVTWKYYFSTQSLTADNSWLTSVTMYDSVQEIGPGAFSGAGSLPELTLPSSVNSVGADAFSNCGSLSSVVFEGKTDAEVQAMANYPWGVADATVIHGSLG